MNEFKDYLESKNHSKSTQKAYLRNVNLFLQWYGQDVENCPKAQIVKYLEYLQTTKKQENNTRNLTLTSLNHYFTFLVKTERATGNPTVLLKMRGIRKRKLYKLYTPEELEALYDNFYHGFIRNYDDRKIKPHYRQVSKLARERNYIMLGILLYQGCTTKELERITLADMNTNKGTVRISRSKKSNERTLPLKATQIGALINYIENIRPQFLNYCTQTERLFFALPESGKKHTSSTNLMGTLKVFTHQVRSLDTHFLNFKQVRTTVITQWLQTEGLRKTQYLAGHKYISSTEKYLPNNIAGLTNDIAKFNPF